MKRVLAFQNYQIHFDVFAGGLKWKWRANREMSLTQ